MNRTETEAALEQVGVAHMQWNDAKVDLTIQTNRIMRRLIHEAIANRMSADDVARLSGYTVKRVRDIMRTYDLDPKSGKQLLSRKAAEALANNAELLGIEPSEMDLMSPLAYLPAGSELRKQMAAEQVSQVDPDAFLETDAEVERLTEIFKAGWHSRDAYWREEYTRTGAESESDRTQAGIRAVLEALR